MAPIINIVTLIRDNLLIVVPLVLTICFITYGMVMAMGDHAKGRQGVIWAFVGGAISLGASTLAAAIHA